MQRSGRQHQTSCTLDELSILGPRRTIILPGADQVKVCLSDLNCTSRAEDALWHFHDVVGLSQITVTLLMGFWVTSNSPGHILQIAIYACLVSGVTTDKQWTAPPIAMHCCKNEVYMELEQSHLIWYLAQKAGYQCHFVH